MSQIGDVTVSRGQEHHKLHSLYTVAASYCHDHHRDALNTKCSHTADRDHAAGTSPDSGPPLSFPLPFPQWTWLLCSTLIPPPLCQMKKKEALGYWHKASLRLPWSEQYTHPLNHDKKNERDRFFFMNYSIPEKCSSHLMLQCRSQYESFDRAQPAACLCEEHFVFLKYAVEMNLPLWQSQIWMCVMLKFSSQWINFFYKVCI